MPVRITLTISKHQQTQTVHFNGLKWTIITQQTVNFQLFISYASFSCAVNGCLQAPVHGHLKLIPPDAVIPNKHTLGIYTVGQKNTHTIFWLKLCQLLTNFRSSFTG